MHYTTVIKDAFWQILGRMISAFSGFFVVTLITPLLGPLRYGDYTTILSYFALWSALSDLGLYVIGIREMGNLKAQYGITDSASYASASPEIKEHFSRAISQFIWSRLMLIVIVYTVAIVIAYFIPSYASNPYIVRWLPGGMIFSALFMIAGILQLPLQLFWKMEHVSIGLILARVSQILFLGIIVYAGRWQDGSTDTISLGLFIAVIASVVVSALTQTAYTSYMAESIVPLRRIPSWSYMWQHIRQNGKYGAAFFLSSFHLLIVALLLSVMYPTIDWFIYAGIRWLSLQLIQILLIIPSSIANSVLHRITSISPLGQKQAFGYLIAVVIWFGYLCLANFTIFASHIIYFVSGDKYIHTDTTFSLTWLRHLRSELSNGTIPVLGADVLLPFLGIVLLLSFIKTIYNYIFVAAHRQNTIFPVNLWWVIIGWSIATILVYQYNIIGGIVGQLTMEALFVCGSWIYAIRHQIAPHLPWRWIGWMTLFFGTLMTLWLIYNPLHYTEKTYFLTAFIIMNIVLVSMRYPYIKWLFKSMTSLMHWWKSESQSETIIGENIA